MPDIFSDLSSLGLGGLNNVKLFEDDDKKAPTAVDKADIVKEPVKVNEEDFIFDKKVKCPVCDKDFTTKTVKAGKVRLIGSDSDLRPKYEQFDTIKYDIVSCPYCGYSALTRFFGNLTAFQVNEIKNNVGVQFKGTGYKDGPLSYDQSIVQHKLALLVSVVKKGKMSERAYTCLKLAWLYRGKDESLDMKAADYRKLHEECVMAEREFLSNAYDGFSICVSKEVFPICGMDEHTFNYLLADVARRIGKYDEALRLVSRILVTPGANAKIKDKARTLKDLIKK